MVSTDNSLLFITGESDEMYCVEADSGRLQWAHDGGDSGFVAKPIFRSRDGEDGVLYTITVSLLLQHLYFRDARNARLT